MKSPSTGARVGLALANAAGAVLCGYAAMQTDSLPVDATQLSIVFWCIGAACLGIGLPGSVVEHPGVRSLSRALAAVGIAAGGAASVIATVLS